LAPVVGRIVDPAFAGMASTSSRPWRTAARSSACSAGARRSPAAAMRTWRMRAPLPIRIREGSGSSAPRLKPRLTWPEYAATWQNASFNRPEKEYAALTVL